MSKPKPPPKIEEIRNNWSTLYDVLRHETDTVCAVVATAYLDHCLWALVGSAFAGESTKNEMLAPDGCLGDSWSKARVAYCTGLIPKGLLNNIQIVCQIRNLFAHKMDVLSFDVQSVTALCDKLTIPKKAPIKMPMPKNLDEMASFIYTNLDPRTNRGRFTNAVGAICTTLEQYASCVSPFPVLSDNWDQTTWLSSDNTTASSE